MTKTAHDVEDSATTPRTSKLKRISIPPWPILLLSFVIIFGAVFILWGPVRPMAWRIDQFPATNLERPQWQQNITNVTRQQFLDKPDGSRYFGPMCTDQILPEPTPQPEPPRDGDSPAPDVVKKEFPYDCDGKWDAAFVSWVMNEVGMPLAEPTPEDPYAWLEPDVDRMIERFRANDAFHEEPDFMPQIGDIVFYDDPWPLGKHVNFVVDVRGDLVTVGGDEVGGVGVATMKLAHRGGILGFGATGKFERPAEAAPEAVVAN